MEEFKNNSYKQTDNQIENVSLINPPQQIIHFIIM